MTVSCSSVFALLHEGRDAAVLPQKWHRMNICGINEDRDDPVDAIQDAEILSVGLVAESLSLFLALSVLLNDRDLSCSSIDSLGSICFLAELPHLLRKPSHILTIESCRG